MDYNRLIIFLCLTFFLPGKGSAQLDSTSINDAFKKANMLMGKGEYEKTITLLKPVISSSFFKNKIEESQKIEILFVLGEAHLQMRFQEEALEIFQDALALSIKMNPQNKRLLRDAYDFRSWAYSKLYQPVKSVQDLKEVLRLDTELEGPESKAVANTLMNLGLDLYKMGAFTDAENQMMKALELFKKVSKEDSEDFNRIYNNLGVIYHKIGDDEHALEYAEKALEIKLKNYSPNHPSVAKYYMNIGEALAGLGKTSEAISFYQKNLEILKANFPEKNLNVSAGIGELANIYADDGQYDLSIQLQKQCIKLEKGLVNPSHPYHIASYVNLASVFLEKKDFESALQTIDTVLILQQKASYFPDYKRIEISLLQAEIYEKAGKKLDALRIIKDCFQRVFGTLDLDSEKANKAFQAFQEKYLLIELLNAFSRYQPSSLEGRRQQYLAYERCLDWISELRKTLFSRASRLYLNEDTREIYENAVAAAFQLAEETGDHNYYKKALTFSDEGKANILKIAVQSESALKLSGVPEVLQDSLLELQVKLNRLEEAVEDKKSENLSYNLEEKQLFDAREAYFSFLNHLENQYPRYYNEKYGQGTVKPEEVQGFIKDDQLGVLSYYYNDSLIFIFLIKKDGFQTWKIDKPSDFDSKVNTFFKLNQPSSLPMGKDESETYFKLAFDFYKLLIPENPGDLKRLAIVPYGLLNFIPFEALIESNRPGLNFKNANYLARRFSIFYAPSLFYWMNSVSNENDATVPFSGFAPNYSNGVNENGQRNQLSGLYWNDDEIKEIQGLLSGQIFSGNAATETNFKAFAAQSGILHLAMHALTNDQFPNRSGLVFYDSKGGISDTSYLNLLEIFHLKLKAKLLYLNACNTGSGKLLAGEGILSLANAFSYSGCESICMNKWLVDDEAASKLATAFYQNLKNGMSKDEALQKAKLRYLEAADPLTAHPYFWAGTMIVGNMEPVFVKTNSFYWWVFLLLGILLAMGIWKIKKT
ncbi:MAG: CHAT domain-containing tetratricopeptide repeat protein [Saprospiraceae bacterium]